VREVRYDPPSAAEKKAGYPVLRAVCAVYSISRADLERVVRTPGFVDARRMAIYMLHDAGVGVTASGRLLRRDHSTVISHLRRAQALLARGDYETREGIALVRREMARQASARESRR
jgi:chromosomal replication initiation ATPase DnaA